MAETARLTAIVENKGAKKSTDELKDYGKAANDAEKSTDELTGSGKRFSSSSRKLVSSLKSTKAGLIGIGIAATSAVLAIATLKDETAILANIAGVSFQEFQKLSAGFATIGFSGEKTSDTLKDINEKVGEFVLLGTGEFKDVFDNILQPMGVTIEQLRKMGSREILGAVARGLDAMNASGKESSALLESMANDATALIPLLKDNASELSRISDEIEEKGLLLTDAEAQALSNANRELLEMKGYFDSFLSKSKGIIAEFLFGGDEARTIETVSKELDAINDRLASLGEGGSGSKTRGGRKRGGARERAQELKQSLTEELTLLKSQQTQKIQTEQVALVEEQRIRGIQQELKDKAKKAAKEKEIEAAKKAADKLLKIEEDRVKAEKDLAIAAAEEKQQTLEQSLGVISGLMGSENDKLFRIGQAASLASIAVAAPKGISEALAFGPIAGPILAAGMAAAFGAQAGAVLSAAPPSAREQGGQFSRGQDLIVGERGPERVSFNDGGRISNAGETAGMNGANQKITFVAIDQSSGGKKDFIEQENSDGRIVVLIRDTVSGDLGDPNSKISKSQRRNIRSERNI